jgi:hypothetical protein
MVKKGQRADYMRSILSPVPSGITMSVTEDEFGNVTVEIRRPGHLGARLMKPSVWDEPDVIRADARKQVANLVGAHSMPDVVGGEWWGE